MFNPQKLKPTKNRLAKADYEEVHDWVNVESSLLISAFV